MRWRDESGHTLVELLITGALMLVIFGAVLGSWGAFTNEESINQRVSDAQDRVRQAVDVLTHELRNAASPTPQQPNAIDKATSTDLVFQTVDPSGPPAGGSQNTQNVQRVRYCLDTSNAANERLYRQVQRWTTSSVPAAPSTAQCPSNAGGWVSTRVVADSIVNAYAGQSRPVFAYDSTTLTAITWIVPELFIDVNPGQRPAETRLKTGIYLRNQNRAPTAGFGISIVLNVLGSAHVILNASVSRDPEGDPLTYVWWDGSTKLTACNDQVVCDTTLAGSGSHSLTLTVYDSAGLSSSAAAQVVNVL